MHILTNYCRSITQIPLRNFLKHQQSIPQTTWNKVTTHQPINQMQVQPKFDNMGINLFAESKQENRQTSLSNDNLVPLDVLLCPKTCLKDWNEKKKKNLLCSSSFSSPVLAHNDLVY
jgi:hypothetical protein